MKITAVIITKNEEARIESCILALSFCDETIVVDDFSTDQTLIIAKSLGAKVFQRSLNGDFAGQKNYGIEQAKNEWVISIDADEIVTKNLASEIQGLDYSAFDGFRLNRKNYYKKQWLKGGGYFPDWQLRLFKKNLGRFSQAVHERVELNGKVGDLTSTLDHMTYSSINQVYRKIRQYSQIEADSVLNKRNAAIKMLVFPPIKFLQTYVLQKGIVDGWFGFVNALLIGYYMFYKHFLAVKKI